MRRRDFLKKSFFSLAGLGFLHEGKADEQRRTGERVKVVLVKTLDRAHGVRESINLLGINPFKGRNVFIKPNFNSAHPCPGSTHNDTLIELIKVAHEMGGKKVEVGDRSGFAGMITTHSVLEEKGIYEIGKKYDARILNFDLLEDKDWIKFKAKGIHWFSGFKIARPVVESECLLLTPCLKTHRFGGVFTMSLKLAVGAVKKSYMTELHSSYLSMRKMIAEINLAFTPSIIVMDGVDAFVDGGPEKGKLKKAGVFIAGTDRVAVDAVGLAILKELGSNRDIMEKGIFEQEQIKRAVELGIGVSSPHLIDIVTGDEESENYARKIRDILSRG